MNPEPDYKKLQRILSKQYGREVTLEEVVATGKHLIRIYELILK